MILTQFCQIYPKVNTVYDKDKLLCNKVPNEDD